MHLLPPDDCGLTDETIVDFLNGLQFSNGHDALSAAERAGELLRPLERASRAARFCGDVQQAAAGSAFRASLKTGMLPSVWKCSHAMPCGSVTQCLSLRA